MKINIAVKPCSTIVNKTGGWRTFKPNFSYDKCISCGLCSRICPEGCIVMKNLKQYEKLKPITDYNYCKGCGLCAEECPAKAVIMEKEEK
ncbi:MAG: 4Fe-4S binding protein [bacterium]|nr:4Fe-4S binding protein [bacterium]